jgi:hypothetical protein
MSKFMCKSVHFEQIESTEVAKSNLTTLFSDDFADSVLSTLNGGQIRILNNSWEQLRADLLRYEPSTVSISLFLFHFHNYV